MIAALGADRMSNHILPKMNKYSSLHIFLILFILVLQRNAFAQKVVIAKPEEVGMSSARLANLTTNLQDYVSEEKLAGGVALIARRGKIIYLQPFGKSDPASNIPMTENSIFRIASQTKAITSVGIMILQEQGDLLITDPVGKYIPAFQETTVAEEKEDGTYQVVKADRPVTIRDLLTHTAGIGYGYGPGAEEWQKANIQGWYFADREEPIQETVSRMGNLPFEAQPGEKFVYGYSTDILGAIIEVVSGQTVDEFLKKKILEPLEMNDTHFYLPKNKEERLATVYSLTEEGLQKAPAPGGMTGQGEYVYGPRKSFSGGAGLLSTAPDYANFLQMLLNKGKFNGQQILSPKTVELMTVDHLKEGQFPWAEGTGFGLGFTVLEDLGARGTPGTEGEFGWGGAYHSTYWVDPEEELLVVYMTQLIPANDLDDHEKLRALVYQAIVD